MLSQPTRSEPVEVGKEANDDKDMTGEIGGTLVGNVTLLDMRGKDALLVLGSVNKLPGTPASEEFWGKVVPDARDKRRRCRPSCQLLLGLTKARLSKVLR